MEDKQKNNLEMWATGGGIDFVNKEAEAAYQYRANLIKDAIELKKTPDRVPIAPSVTWAPVFLYNTTIKNAMYDADVLGQIFYDYACEFNVDGASMPAKCGYGPTLDAIDYNLYKWAGGSLEDNSATQFVEKEYMTVAEYDHLIQDPTDFMLRVYLPRTAGALKPIADVGSLYGIQEITTSNGFFSSFGAPHIREAFMALLEAGKQHFEWTNKLRPHIMKIMSAGYPFTFGGSTKVPFDFLGDTLRGTTHLMMDMYRRPEKILQACERLVPLMVKMGVDGFRASKNPIVFIPLHKGADGFMSDAQFKKFYWPFMKAVMEGLVDEGCIPFCFVEGSYNERLEYLTDVPKGRCVYYFDKIDMAKARKTLEGIACIGGGFPISQILTGTVETVRDETKKMLEIAAGDGGYILGISSTMDEVNRENLHAFIQAGKDFGKY